MDRVSQSVTYSVGRSVTVCPASAVPRAANICCIWLQRGISTDPACCSLVACAGPPVTSCVSVFGLCPVVCLPSCD
jgi:hypothetical protein